VSFGIFFLLTFGATTIQQIQIGSGGSTFINSPYAIITKVSIMALFAIFALTAFVANVVVRDDDTGYGPIIHATPITKFDYLFGRFTGAFAATALMATSLPLGILIGSFMPWLDPVKLGPFRPGDYVFAYFVIIVPTLFIMHGVSGSGKSWMSEKLVPRLGAIRIRSDVERKRLADVSPSLLKENDGYEEGLYTPALSHRTYARLLECADGCLKGGFDTIVDAAFP